MKVVETKSSLQSIEKGWVLTIGNFDGVHLGHQEIIKAAKAASTGLAASGVAVMTFDPHPVAILHPEKAPAVLTPLELKKHLLESCGVDCLIVLKDSYELLNLSPEDFVHEFLNKTVRPAVVVEGSNFNFGYGRSGNIQTLKDLSADRGFEVIEVAAKKLSLPDDRRSVICSSSLIRNLLETGRVESAAAVMDRPYRLIGRVVPGRGKGKKLGFPTANIEPHDQIIPDEGVYAGFVETGERLEDICIGGVPRPAALSIGRAKTFVTEHPLLIEAHILQDNVEDLSDKYLAMDFVKRIRGQRRFETSGALKEQIAQDCDQVKTVLSV